MFGFGPYGDVRLWLSIILGLKVVMTIIVCATKSSETGDQSNIGQLAILDFYVKIVDGSQVIKPMTFVARIQDANDASFIGTSGGPRFSEKEHW